MKEKRTSNFENGLIWFGAGVSIAEILTGTYFAPLGFGKAVWAILIGHIIGCSMMFAAGLIGGKARKSAMETVKMSFGSRGSLLFSILNIVQLVGWTAIIYIASISGIDTELYEAAEIDGAGRWAKIVHVTIPGIMNTFVVMLLLAIGGIMNAGFEQYYVFSNPLITNEIEVLDTYVYKIGLGRGQYAFSVAVGMFKSVVSVVLLFAVNKLSKRARGESII